LFNRLLRARAVDQRPDPAKSQITASILEQPKD
jgi:hypothetical protein